MSFDKVKFGDALSSALSQSLWNRAMSFDGAFTVQLVHVDVSQSLWNRAMSFDRFNSLQGLQSSCLNPFGTGQCLSTAVGC